MARPTKADVDSGNQGWDAQVDDNFEIAFEAPFPAHVHTGDESDLQSTFAAAAYDQCMVWVDHTTLGMSLYVSDGTSWQRFLRLSQLGALTALTDSSGGTANDTVAAVSGSGDDTNINNNFADLAAKVNAIMAALGLT